MTVARANERQCRPPGTSAGLGGGDAFVVAGGVTTCGSGPCMRGRNDGGSFGRAAVSLGALGAVGAFVGTSFALGGGVAVTSPVVAGSAFPAVTGTPVAGACGSVTTASGGAGARNRRHVTPPMPRSRTTIAAIESCELIDRAAGAGAVTKLGGAAAGADTVKCGPV